MRINNNMAAVITNNQLLGTESSLSVIMERLSSGFSINHAGDNPSGIAIAGKMQAQIDGLNKASNNGSDGISVLQTAEGALNEVTSMIQRMRELCVQAANGTNAKGERESIQLEIDSLKEEIDRISTTTQFNTLNLLDGTLDNRTYAENCTRIQTSNSVAAGLYTLTIEKAATPATLTSVEHEDDTGKEVSFIDYIDSTDGLQEEGTLSINNITITLSQGMSGEEVYEFIRQTAELAGAKVSDPTQNFLQITSKKFGADANLVVDFSSDKFARALGFTAEKMGITSDIKNTANVDFEVYVDSQKYMVVEEENGEQKVKPHYGLADGGYVIINGVKIEFDQGDSGAVAYGKLVAAATESATKAEYDEFKVSKSAEGLLQITDVNTIEYSSQFVANALGIEYRGDKGVHATKTGTNAEIKLATNTSTSQFGAQATVQTDGNKIKITDVKGFEMSFLAEEGYQYEKNDDGTVKCKGDIVFTVTDIGSLTLQIGANKGQTMDVRIGSASTEYLYIDDLDVTIANGPEEALDKLDDALEYITSLRSQLGAYENRLDHTTRSLDETSENMTSAISRIEDADMATTMVEYTRLNVLEQAGTSALAQANELPQLALQLLQ